jgi:mediator of RNA polymerase II transcription subunit 6
MDENPLVGEPGSFVFTSSKQHLQSQQDLAAKKAAQQALPKVHVNTKAAPTPEPTRPPTPQNKPDGPKRTKTMEKTGEVRKPKRRKSRVPKSPGSPASPVSAI